MRSRVVPTNDRRVWIAAVGLELIDGHPLRPDVIQIDLVLAGAITIDGGGREPRRIVHIHRIIVHVGITVKPVLLAGIGLEEALQGGIVGAGGKPVPTQLVVIPLALCFPAGTLVATPGGQQPIETLHVGDQVLAEDPTTGKVAVERVLAVLKDPVSPLMEVRLSDGSRIKVTVSHPFWVDGNADFANAGWRAAGELQVGDRLRTASGADVTVVGLRYHVGQAIVYTLTVSLDHTFFVGSARVLVHNAVCANILKSVVKEDTALLRYARQAGKDAGWRTQTNNLLEDVISGAIIRKRSIPAMRMLRRGRLHTDERGRCQAVAAFPRSTSAGVPTDRFVSWLKRHASPVGSTRPR